MRYPEHLIKILNLLKKLPGVGTKTAERYAFHLLNWSDSQLKELAGALTDLKERICECPRCFALMDGEQCLFCASLERHRRLLCIVAFAKDVFAVEETREYRGLYHVLGGLLSPISSYRTDLLRVEELKRRLAEEGIEEVILAMDSTLEGDATALFLRRELESFSLSITRLAFGLPMGSALDLIDGGTLTKALLGRHRY